MLSIWTISGKLSLHFFAQCEYLAMCGWDLFSHTRKRGISSWSNWRSSKNIVLALPVFTFHFLFFLPLPLPLPTPYTSLLFRLSTFFCTTDFVVRLRLCNAFWHVSQCPERVGSWPCVAVCVCICVCLTAPSVCLCVRACLWHAAVRHLH